MEKRLIYALKCPFKNEIHYIGKSTSGLLRPESHLNNSHSKKINVWVENLKSFGQRPIIEILTYVSEVENIDEVEQYYINKYVKKGNSLLNINHTIPETVSPILDRKDPSNLKGIGEFIKMKRKETGLTQVRFANMMGVGLRFLRELEQNSKDNFQTEPLNILLSAFGYKLSIEPIEREKFK